MKMNKSDIFTNYKKAFENFLKSPSLCGLERCAIIFRDYLTRGLPTQSVQDNFLVSMKEILFLVNCSGFSHQDMLICQELIVKYYYPAICSFTNYSKII